MAGEPWNRVNIPFPSAVSSVRVHITTETGTITSLGDDGYVGCYLCFAVLKLIRSEILQTEIRVLYELLYNLNNSSKGNKTFKGLKQVEQCVNRLKNMKIDVALQELADICPNRIQRQLSIKDGECVVPSQPMLEWICLKVLGAAQLMSCTLNRCTTASLLLELLKDVAHAQPMPFLTDFSLPADIAQLLGPSDAYLLSKHPAHRKDRQDKKQRAKKFSVKVRTQALVMMQTLGLFSSFSGILQRYVSKSSASFTHMATHLDEMILWCKSQRMGKEKRLLNFLRQIFHEIFLLYVQRKLQTFKKEVCWASSPQGSAPKTFHSLTSRRRSVHLRAHVQTRSRQFMSSTVRTGVKRRQKGPKLSGLRVDDQQSKSTEEATHQATDPDSHDDIDDIFASVGL
uniref:Nucleolus and neural progenitor protein n=1 Tax=Amphilophus citrinellus TaxID=61819 RepID=A0A3Q0SCM9_AMPCI